MINDYKRKNKNETLTSKTLSGSCHWPSLPWDIKRESDNVYEFLSFLFIKLIWWCQMFCFEICSFKACGVLRKYTTEHDIRYHWHESIPISSMGNKGEKSKVLFLSKSTVRCCLKVLNSILLTSTGYFRAVNIGLGSSHCQWHFWKKDKIDIWYSSHLAHTHGRGVWFGFPPEIPWPADPISPYGFTNATNVWVWRVSFLWNFRKLEILRFFSEPRMCFCDGIENVWHYTIIMMEITFDVSD